MPHHQPPFWGILNKVGQEAQVLDNADKSVRVNAFEISTVPRQNAAYNISAAIGRGAGSGIALPHEPGRQWPRIQDGDGSWIMAFRSD